MSSSGRADGRTGTPRDVFPMPRDSSFSCASDSGKDKRKERDAFTRRLSSSISLDGVALASKRRPAPGGGSELASYSGRSVGVSSNGWHDDVISRSRNLVDSGTRCGSGSSVGGVASPSPRLDCSSADDSPRELDGYRFSKPSSPLFTQSRISPLAQSSHNSFTGKGVLAREHSRCSEWDSPFKMDMEYRDKIWGRSEILKRTGSSSYEAATVLNTHKDIAGRREQDGYGGSGDSTGSSSYHIRSYQEWRPSSALPLRMHVSNNGHLKESAVREQGLSDVLGSYSSNWHSPLSSPVNYTVDGGRDDGSQTSPRKRPRLGWGQGLAKYEKKLTGGAEDGLGSRGRTSICSEEILLSHADSPHQGTGHGQEALSTKVVADGSGGACVEMDKDISAIEMDRAAGPGIDDEIEKNEEVGSMTTASEMVGLDSCKNSDASFVSKLCQNSETSIQMQPQTVLPGQFGSEDDSGKLKANILQRLEKLELELDLTEKEYAKLEVQPEVHSSSSVSVKNDSMVDVARNSVVAEVQLDAHTLEQKDCVGEIIYTTEVREAGKEVVDDQIGMSSSRIQENSLCLHSKTDSKQSSFEVHRSLSFDSFPTVSVSSKGEDGIIQPDGCNSQRSSLKGSSQSAASFSDPGEMTGVSDSKEINADNLLINTRGQFSNIPSKPGVSIKNDASECWKVLYNDNQEQAERTSKVLANLLPDAKVESGRVPVGKSKDMLIQEESTESRERIKQQLQDMLSEKNKIVRFREQVLALRYRALRETWKHEQAGLCQWSDRSEGVKKSDIDRRNGTLTPSQRTSHRLRLSGTAKLDAASDEVQTMQKLMAEPLSGYQRTHLKMPCQILDEKERSIQRFISNNALIEDPVAFEQERKTINPWTPEEKKIFLDTFFLYNKNFQKIASFIEHKTVADCIEFYYRNQKSDEFEMVRRKQRLKNRRDYSLPSAYLATTTPPSNRRREMTAITVDNLPDPASVNSDNGGVVQSRLSKNVDNNQFVSVVSSNFDNPPGNAGSVTGRNVTTEHSNKVKAVQSPRLTTTITEEFDSQWTDHERQLFVTALAMFGKDFKNISQHVATKSEGQCKAFFSKTRKRLGLDQVLETFQMSMHEGSEQQLGGDTEDLNTAADLEDSKCRGMGGMQDDAKDVNETNVGECLPLGSDAIAGVVSADSTEEPLIAESRDTEKGDDKQNVEDERSIASITELKDDLPENTEKEALSYGIEEATGKAVEVIPLFPEPLSEPKDEEVDYPGITTDLVAEPETCGRVEDTKDQQNAYVDEQIPSTPHSKYGREDQTNESTSVVDTIERPAVEEKDLQPDPLSQVRQESPDVTHMSHNSSNQTSVAPMSTNASIVAPTGQPKVRGNTSSGESKPRREATSWTQDEKEKFVDIIRKHGRDWTLLQESLPAKSMTQIKTYFQNSKAKLGFTAGEGTNSRSAANRKHKVDDSDSTNTLYNLAHHKAASLSDESGQKSDQNVNGSISTMLGAPVSDALSFTLFGKGKWQAEDPTAFSGMQKVFQQMCSNGYTQQSVPSNGLFPLFQPSALPVLTPPGFQQPQNLVLQQSLSHATPSKPQLAAPQQTQQIASVQQSQTSSTLCNLQTQVVNQIKQQQKPSQVIAHCQQDYQSQGNQQLQKWILQQQAVQSFQQNILPSVLQQQPPPQTQVLIQQQNQPQHLSQSSHHAQHAIKQNIHYLQQQPSIQAFGQLTAVASQQLSSNHHQKVINQHQLSSQQQLMNQLQLHYDDQQKQYHLVQSNQLSQQQQHSILGSLQEQLVLQLHHHQQNLQSEKQQQPIWTNLPVHLLDNSEVSHHQQVQNPDILSEKEKMQRQELHNCQSVSLHKGTTQVLSKDASNLPDPIEPKNIPTKAQQNESGHLQDSQADVQVLAHPQSKPVAFAESHPTRAGDVKLFGKVLVSQPTSCMNITPSPSENAFSQPAFSLLSVPASTVVVSVSEGLPDTYPDGTPCVPSGLGRIGPSYTQGHSFNLPWQSTSAGSFGGRNNLLDGRQLACFVKRADSENDMQNNQVALSRMAQRLIRDTKECDNSCPEVASPSQKFEGCEQLKRMQDDQNAVTGLGIKRSIDQGNGLILNGDLSASNSDLKSDMPRVPCIADLSSMLSRNKDLDLSSTMGAMLGVPVSSSQALPGTVVDAHLAIADWHSSRELRFVGSHSSKELHQSQDFPGNKVGHANDAGKLVITNNQPLPLAHSFAAGVENSQFTRENSFFGKQAILHGSGNVGLNMSMWNSGTVVGSGNDLHRVNMPTVSSVWAHHSMTVESQPRTTDSRDAEDNKRNT